MQARKIMNKTNRKQAPGPKNRTPGFSAVQNFAYGLYIMVPYHQGYVNILIRSIADIDMEKKHGYWKVIRQQFFACRDM